ncbi:MAG: hypothetical protein ACRDP3_10900, partial [Streptomyces sp.]|uniref:hypothetical protein n=1 Tax=Streptomyces sp. TaxID=1931 RepID=UPI003D6AD36A
GQAGHSLGQYAESVARGEVLSRLLPPHEEPTSRWFMDVLTAAPLPEGVHRTAAGSDPLMTLCSTVADLEEDRITLRGADGRSSSMPLPDYVPAKAGAA